MDLLRGYERLQQWGLCSVFSHSRKRGHIDVRAVNSRAKKERMPIELREEQNIDRFLGRYDRGCTFTSFVQQVGPETGLTQSEIVELLRCAGTAQRENGLPDNELHVSRLRGGGETGAQNSDSRSAIPPQKNGSGDNVTAGRGATDNRSQIRLVLGRKRNSGH